MALALIATFALAGCGLVSAKKTAAAPATSRTSAAVAAAKSRSTSSPSASGSRPGDTPWQAVCQREIAAKTSTWTYTDPQGNEATLTACGYSVTGEDYQGNNADAGQDFVNMVIAVQDVQPDRGVDVVLPVGNLGTPASCSAIDANQVCPQLSNDGIPIMLAESGAIAPAYDQSDPVIDVQPGQPVMLVLTTAVPGPTSSLQIETGNQSFVGTGAGQQNIAIW